MITTRISVTLTIGLKRPGLTNSSPPGLVSRAHGFMCVGLPVLLGAVCSVRCALLCSLCSALFCSVRPALLSCLRMRKPSPRLVWNVFFGVF